MSRRRTAQPALHAEDPLMPAARSAPLIDRSTLLAIGIVLAVWWMASSRSSSPLRPSAPPDRPAVRWVVRAARSLLWITLLAEKTPEIVEARSDVRDQPTVDGFHLVDHTRGL